MLADPKGPFAKLPIHKQARELTDRITKAEKTFTTTLVTRELSKPRKTKVLERGEAVAYGDDVGVLRVPGHTGDLLLLG